MTFKPTQARIALMQAIADGAVAEHVPMRLSRSRYIVHDRSPEQSSRIVTAAANVLIREGLARVARKVGWGLGGITLLELTDEGQSWLTEATP